MVLVDVAVSELLPAQLTFVGLVLAVDDLMSRDLVQALEGAVADLAGVRPLLCRARRDVAQALVRGARGHVNDPGGAFLPECVIMWRFS